MESWEYLSHAKDSEMVGSLNGVDELAVELIGAQRIGQLAEVHLQERRYGVHVLPDGFVLDQSRHAVFVKGIPSLIELILIINLFFFNYYFRFDDDLVSFYNRINFDF